MSEIEPGDLRRNAKGELIKFRTNMGLVIIGENQNTEEINMYHKYSGNMWYENIGWREDTGESVKEHVHEAMPRIVCAACLFEIWRPMYDTLLITGPRHFDRVMTEQIERVFGAARPGVPTQGFVDQWGNFYNRTDAWGIAEKAGQIVRRVGGDDTDGGTLFSENLY